MEVVQRNGFDMEVKDVSIFSGRVLFLFFLQVFGFGVGCALLELLVVFGELLDELLRGFLFF